MNAQMPSLTHSRQPRATLLVALMLCTSPVLATPLTDVAASLAPGQWGELTTTNFNEATLGDGTSFAVFWFSEDLAWDAANRRLYFVGGGHDSDAEFVTYSESTNAWTRAKPTGGFWHPNFSHAYDHLALIPSRGRLYFRQPSSDANDRVEIYDIATATWSRSALMPSRPACCGALEYFPELGGLVMTAGPGPVFLYDPGNNSWRELVNNVAIGDFHNFAEYSPVHRVMIFGGGEGANGRALFRINASGQVTRLGDAPQRIGITYSVVTTDPVSGDFLVFLDNASWQFNPITDTWTALTAVPPWRSIGTPGIFAAVATPIPELGVIVVAKYAGDSSRVYLYRHSASVPRPSISFRADPANVASGGSSVLSWTTGATTDCAGSRGTVAWPGSKATNGTENVGPITAATTFMLSCSGPGGAMQSETTVSLQGSAPPPGNPPPSSGGGGGGGGSLGWLTLALLALCYSSFGYSRRLRLRLIPVGLPESIASLRANFPGDPSPVTSFRA